MITLLHALILWASLVAYGLVCVLVALWLLHKFEDLENRDYINDLFNKTHGGH